jgi:hypothetical protein
MPRDESGAPPINLYAVKLPVYGQHQDCRLIEQGPPIDESTIVEDRNIDINIDINEDDTNEHVSSDNVYYTFAALIFIISVIALSTFLIMKIAQT